MNTPPLYNETIERKSALTLHPKPAFFDWVAAIAASHPLGWSADHILKCEESVVWIIPSFGSFASSAALESYVNSLKPSLLRSELEGFVWARNQWPELSVTSFDAFFQLCSHEHVASIKHLTQSGRDFS